MPRINDIAYVTYRCPDLDLAERFLGDFGMVRAARDENALYMRGAGSRHHIYVARRAATAGFDCVAFTVPSASDLAAFAALPGAGPVAALDEPGGGQRVTLHDPDGFRIDIVHGIAALPDYVAVEGPELARVLPELTGPPVEAYFVYPEELRTSKRISVFRDFLIRKVAEARAA